MRVLLVDDHTLFRQGLKYLLKQLDSAIEVIQCGNCDEAIIWADQLPAFELILLDLNLPGTSGLQAVGIIRNVFPDSRLVVLSGEIEARTVSACIDAGAMGYIPKTTSMEVMHNALRLVLANGIYLPAEILRAAQVSQPPKNMPSVVPFTDRQRAVLKLLVQGASNKRIARELNVCESTVKTHVNAVLRILDVHNRTEAVYVAASLGLEFNLPLESDR